MPLIGLQHSILDDGRRIDNIIQSNGKAKFEFTIEIDQNICMELEVFQFL